MNTATDLQPKTKTEQARDLFNALSNGKRELIEGKSVRQSFIIIAQDEINLTEGAAKTYYTNLLNESRGTGMYCHTSRIKNKKNATAPSAQAVEESTSEAVS